MPALVTIADQPLTLQQLFQQPQQRQTRSLLSTSERTTKLLGSWACHLTLCNNIGFLQGVGVFKDVPKFTHKGWLFLLLARTD